MKTRKCEICTAAFDETDIYGYVAHVSACRPKPEKEPDRRSARVQRETDLQIGRLDRRTDGHKSFVSGSNPRKQTRFTRSERQRLFADAWRRDDRGVVVRPMPNMSDGRKLYGITKLNQDGLAAAILRASRGLKARVPSIQTKLSATHVFGAGV